MTIERISPDIVGQREKFLLYSNPKTGKTFTALTAPEPIHFLAIGGMNEAKTYFSEQFQRKHGKKEIFISSAEEDVGPQGIVRNPRGFDEACRNLDEALEKDESGEMEFQSLIIDNASVLSEYQMNKVIHISSQSAKGEATYDKYIESGILTPYDSDWGAAQSLMTKFVSWLFSLDKHIILIAHQHETSTTDRKTRKESIIAIKPQFIGKQRNDISNMFDNVWHLRKQGQLYYARTEPEDVPVKIIAGTRVGGVLGADYVEPNLSDAIEQLQTQARSVE